MGASDGYPDGRWLGRELGVGVGAVLGTGVGNFVGRGLGAALGLYVGHGCALHELLWAWSARHAFEDERVRVFVPPPHATLQPE